MEKPYVCRFKGCGDAKAERKYSAHHLVSHYLKKHFDMPEGQRQLRLQKAALARAEGEPKPEPEPIPEPDHAADELLPTETEQFKIEELIGQIGDVTVVTDTGQFLEERITTLRSESEIIQKQLAEIGGQLEIIATELTATLAAKAAWDKAAQPKVKTAGGEPSK